MTAVLQAHECFGEKQNPEAEWV